MRSIKRPRRPVRRYRSLLAPGIALLAVFAFWAAFASPEETVRFEYSALKLEITNVREADRESGYDGMTAWEYPVYAVAPGAEARVLEADMAEENGVLSPQWSFYLEPGGRRLEITDGMEPVELTPEVTGVGRESTYVLRFVPWNP